MRGWLNTVSFSSFSWATLRQSGVALTTGPFGTVLSASEYVQDGIPLINPTHIKDGRFAPDPLISVSRATALRLDRHRLGEGDLVVGRHGDVGRSALVSAAEAGWLCGGGSIAIRANSARLSPRFLQWVLTSHVARAQLLAASNGATMDTINEPILLGLAVPAPSLPAQIAIANFLDTETARIDALIEKKRQMIELLDELLVARIERLLFAHATGEVRLRRLLVEPPQYGASESGEIGEESWPRYVRITDLSASGQLREENVRCLPPAVARRYMLADEDVLITRSGATVGKAFIYRNAMGPCCFAGYLIRFRFDPHLVLPGLIEMWTRTRHYWSQIGEASIQATIENVSAERYRDLRVPVVSPSDQEGVLRELQRCRAATEAGAESLTRQIALLHEHRQALITAAVTGELEIEGVAA